MLHLNTGDIKIHKTLFLVPYLETVISNSENKIIKKNLFSSQKNIDGSTERIFYSHNTKIDNSIDKENSEKPDWEKCLIIWQFLLSTFNQLK